MAKAALFWIAFWFCLLFSTQRISAECAVCKSEADDNSSFTCENGHQFCAACALRNFKVKYENAGEFLCNWRVDNKNCTKAPTLTKIQQLVDVLDATDPEYESLKRFWLKVIEREEARKLCEGRADITTCPDCDALVDIPCNDEHLYCPKTECESSAEKGEGFCRLCRLPYHYRLNCAQFQRKIAKDINWLDPEVAETEWRKMIEVKQCDNPSCQALIARQDGCNSMVCGANSKDKGGKRSNRGCGKALKWESLKFYNSPIPDDVFMTLIRFGKMQPPPDSSLTQWEGHEEICGQCNKMISSVKYDCLNCPAQTFCFDCAHRNREHNRSHALVANFHPQFRVPRNQNRPNVVRQRHRALWYHGRIPDLRACSSGEYDDGLSCWRLNEDLPAPVWEIRSNVFQRSVCGNGEVMFAGLCYLIQEPE